MKHRESEQTQLRVSRLLNRDSVMLHAEMPSVQTALETLVELQESNGVITNGTAYYKAVCERERAGGTTAIGEGLAIPHACNAGVASLGLAALTLTRGLDWGAADGKLVDMIFMVAVPPGPPERPPVDFGSPCQPAQRPPPDGKTAYGGYARGVYPHPEPDRSGNLCINEAKTARNTKAIQHPIAETEKNIIL